MNQKLLYFLLLLCSLQASSLLGQVAKDTMSKEEGDLITIQNSDFFEFRGDLEPPEQHYKGNVKMTHDSVFMFSDSAMVTETFLTAVGEVIILQEDTIRLFSDSLYYDSESKLAKLYYNVVLENGKQQLFTERLNYNVDTKIAIYPDTALLRNDRTQLSSLRGFYNVDAALATFVGQVTVIDKEFTLNADSLQYNTDIDKAYFLGPTHINQGDRKIYCEDGYYDIKNGNAEFRQAAKFEEEEKFAQADLMLYDKKAKTITLIGNAKYKDGDKNATADQMVYNEQTKDIFLKGSAYFDDGKTIATGDQIKYNEESEKVDIIGQAFLDSDESSIVAESLSFDEETGVGVFDQNVEFVNKSDSVSIYAEKLIVNDSTKSYRAFGESRPYMLRFIDGDSLFLAADTLDLSERIDSLDTIKIFKAYKDVRILSESFQAVSDSMYYDSKDSLFTLYSSPIMWSDSMQFTADTIRLKLKDGGVDKVYLDGNGMINELIQGEYYNQLKGKKIETKIDSGEIVFMELRQNAESNYYILDGDKAFVGLNHTLCNLMDFYFEEGELDDIKFYEKPTSLLTPMAFLKEDQKFLKGFNWNTKLKPKTLEGLLKVKEKIEIRNEMTVDPEKEGKVKEEGKEKIEDIEEQQKKDQKNK